MLLYNDEQIDILVVEDDDIKQACIVRAIKASIPNIRVVGVHNGPEAQFFFTQRFKAFHIIDSVNPPGLVLLDFGVPFSDSYSIIGEVPTYNKDGSRFVTPVVVFVDSETFDVYIEDRLSRLCAHLSLENEAPRPAFRKFRDRKLLTAIV